MHYFILTHNWHIYSKSLISDSIFLSVFKSHSAKLLFPLWTPLEHVRCEGDNMENPLMKKKQLYSLLTARNSKNISVSTPRVKGTKYNLFFSNSDIHFSFTLQQSWTRGSEIDCYKTWYSQCITLCLIYFIISYKQWSRIHRMKFRVKRGLKHKIFTEIFTILTKHSKFFD